MDSSRNFLSNIFDKVGPFWNYLLIEKEYIHITIGSIILALVLFIIGWKLLTSYFRKKSTNPITAWIKDESLKLWIENLILLIGFLTLTVLTLMVVGISPKIFDTIWNLKLFTIKDNHITFANIFIGFILLLVTGRLARYLSHRFQIIFLSGTKLDIGTQKSVETVIRYLLIIIFLMFILSLIGIPLSAFTVVGGALALGIGLGSQQMVNNFLSGLVLMAERPLKVGDVVEIEGKMGTVEYIGGRATRIKTYDEVRIVLPNSKLLENSFINWSLGDDLVRREITVGVAYGSDTVKVMEILKKVTAEENGVENKPEPVVLFSEFGDNTLNFRILYWVRLSNSYSPLAIASNIRLKIDTQFKESGIVIAFPQRDIHFDHEKPIEIKMVQQNKNQGISSPD